MNPLISFGDTNSGFQIGINHGPIKAQFHIQNITTIRPLAHSIYKSLFNTSDLFGQFRSELGTLISVLNATEEHTPKFRPDDPQIPELNDALTECRMVLQDLQQLKEHFDNVGPQAQVTWERMGWGVEELAEIRGKFSSQIQLLDFLNTTMLRSSHENVERMLKTFISEVRSGKRESAAMSSASTGSLTVDEKEAWRSLRKELQSIGITPDLFTQHRHFILSALQTLLTEDEVEDCPVHLDTASLNRREGTPERHNKQLPETAALDPSLGTNVPRGMQDQAKTVELSPAELKGQSQTPYMWEREDAKESETLYRGVLEVQEKRLGRDHADTLFSQGEDAIDDINLTTRLVLRQSIDSIEFVEPENWPERERVELKHTIHVFDDAEAAKIKESLPHNVDGAILITTVQQTMTKGSLDLDKPYRVLYIGQPDFRNIILDKIGHALVSSPTAGSPTSSADSSDYHVVPTSFGAGAVPNFAELLPIHVQLVVDDCKEATAEPHKIWPSTLYLHLNNRPACRSWWDGDQYRISSTSEWTLPDVAILFVSDRDSPTTIQTQHYVHAFLERHGIPAMVISEEPLWKRAAEPIPLDHNSLHMCLESQHPRTGETAVLRRYPIDLMTLDSITPGLLKRSLATLIDLHSKKTPKISIGLTGTGLWRRFAELFKGE